MRRLAALFVLVTVAAACSEPVSPVRNDQRLGTPPSAAFDAAPANACGSAEVTLVAGRHITAGTVTVSNDEDYLYVTYTTDAGWSLVETHAAVVVSPSDFPTNRPGNPKVGRFPLSADHPAGTTTHTERVALSDLGVSAGDDVYVAAHAAVASPNGEESAWGEGTPFVQRGNWAMYFGYTVADCGYDVLILSNRTPDNDVVVQALAPLMPHVTFQTMDVRSQTPSQAYLAGFRTVLLFENGIFPNATNVGDAVGQYVQNGGNVAIGTFYWQDRSDNPNWGYYGWGVLESLDPFLAPRGSEYNADALDTGSIVAHPLTAGLNALSVSSYHGGVAAKPGTTVVARWSDGVPFIGYVVHGGGQRVVGVSVFPAHPAYGGVTGDFWRVWTNALDWAAGGSVPTVVSPSPAVATASAAAALTHDAAGEVRPSGTDGGK